MSYLRVGKTRDRRMIIRFLILGFQNETPSPGTKTRTFFELGDDLIKCRLEPLPPGLKDFVFQFNDRSKANTFQPR